MLEAGFSRIGSYAGGSFPDPFPNATVGVMIEAVHALRAHAVLESIAVPALPDSGGAVVHGIEPAGVLALEEEVPCDIHHAVLGKCLHKDGCAEETRLQAALVLREVGAEPGAHILLGFPFHQPVLQGEEGGSLHGIQNLEFERAVSVQELLLDICLGICLHLLIL